MIVALVLSAGAHAGFISSDWKAGGDGKITLDTNTGLEWLDLTVTAGVSFTNVKQRLSVDLAGWRFATADEAEQLFIDFGLPLVDSNGPNPTLTPAISKMVGLLGNTGPGYLGTYGFVDYSIFPGFHLQKGAFVSSNGDVRMLTANRDGHANDTIDFSFMGSFLVRESAVVPEPAGAILTVTALAIAILTRRRKAFV